MPYVGEIRIFAGTFPPVGWEFCHGQPLSISENDTLFSLIGTTYGGDGQESFNLPDLQGRVPIHMGTGPDGTTFQLGETAGVEEVTLNINQIPVHTHNLPGEITIPVRGDSAGNTSNPAGKAVAFSTGKKFFTKTEPTTGDMAPITLNGTSIGPNQGGQPHTNMQPYVAMNYIISIYGEYPFQG